MVPESEPEEVCLDELCWVLDVDLALSRRIVIPVVVVSAQGAAFRQSRQSRLVTWSRQSWMARLVTWRPSLRSLTCPGMLSRYLLDLVVVLYLFLFQEEVEDPVLDADNVEVGPGV